MVKKTILKGTGRRVSSENVRNSNYRCYWVVGSHTPNSQAEEEGNMKARAVIVNQNLRVAC